MSEDSRLSSAVLYIPEKDIAILSLETVRWYCIGYYVEYQLWAYDFATGKKKFISHDDGFGAGEGVYFSE